jgi:2-polyprenyl-3-methyl-5-hydroxy-6-metoxy-1,4-benzoquinol methylase
MKPTLTRVTHCRVCNSKRILDLLGEGRNYYLANLDQTIPLSYPICQDCHFIFQGEYVGDEFLNHYYRQSPMLRRKEPTVFEIGQNERQGEFLARHVALEGKRVLEIGAHAGAFLRHLDRHHGCTAYFEELSEEARAVLATQDGLHDFRALKGDKKVDVVILRHVLEHIFDLESFLNYVHSILADGGSLFIEVPDWSHFDAHTDPFIFEHLNQFNTAGLVHLLRRTCWQTEALEKSIHPDDPATPNRIQRIVARPINLPALGDVAIADSFRAFAALQYGGWKTAINNLLLGDAAGKTIALYPASHLTFEALTESRLGHARVMGMFDVDVKKHGREILGIKVYPSEELKVQQPDFILIFSMAYEREIRESFAAMGLTSRVISITELVSNSWGSP